MKRYLKKIRPLYWLYLKALSKMRSIRNWWIIPSYGEKRRVLINTSEDYKCDEYFLETGTYMGDTVEFARNYFKQLISVELSVELAANASKRFENESKITIFQGDSAVILGEIIKPINSKILFWLDGHYSSEFWVGDDYIITAKGNDVTPILQELEHIRNHPVKDHVILIDDARLFTGKDGYPHLSELQMYTKDYFPKHRMTVKRDIIRILPAH